MNYVKMIYDLMIRDDFKSASVKERVDMVKKEIYDPHFYKSPEDGWDYMWIYSQDKVKELVQCEVKTSKLLHTYTSHGNVHYTNIGPIVQSSEFVKLLQMIFPLWEGKITLEKGLLTDDIAYKSIEKSIARFLNEKPEYITQMWEREKKTVLFIKIGTHEQVHNGRYAPSDNSVENKTVSEVLEVIVY